MNLFCHCFKICIYDKRYWLLFAEIVEFQYVLTFFWHSYCLISIDNYTVSFVFVEYIFTTEALQLSLFLMLINPFVEFIDTDGRLTCEDPLKGYIEQYLSDAHRQI